jgi:hypothetical protein
MIVLIEMNRLIHFISGPLRAIMNFYFGLLDSRFRGNDVSGRISNLVNIKAFTLHLAGILILSCSTTQKAGEKKPEQAQAKPAAESAQGIAPHYQQLKYPEFQYTPPHPKDYRVKLDSGVIAYLVRDTSLALIDVHFMYASENLPGNADEVPTLSLYSTLLVSWIFCGR